MQATDKHSILFLLSTKNKEKEFYNIYLLLPVVLKN